MATLAQELPQKIARLEQKFGSNNPFVQQLKQQLVAIQNGNKSTKELWMSQAWRNPKQPDTAYDLNNLPVDPALAAVVYSESLYPEHSDNAASTAAKKKRGK